MISVTLCRACDAQNCEHRTATSLGGFFVVRKDHSPLQEFAGVLGQLCDGIVNIIHAWSVHAFVVGVVAIGREWVMKRKPNTKRPKRTR